MNYQLKLVHGPELTQHFEALGKLRIEVFKEYPYLYDGDLDYEKKYLSRYTRSQTALIILAYHKESLIGASTCISLVDEDDDFKDPLLKAGFAPEKIFYFGESTILKSHRGNGIGHEFFKLRERHAQKTTPNLEYTCFCAVERSEHPLRPETYRPLDSFWKRLGYEKQSIHMQYQWKDRDKTHEDEKSSSFG